MGIVVFRAMKSKIITSARRTHCLDLMNLLSSKENYPLIVRHIHNSGDTLYI